MEDEKYPRIGIGVLIKKKNMTLLGLRKGSHGAGFWCFPGGHQKFGETMEACAKRELKEETGLDAENFELISVADEMDYIESDSKHYISIGFMANYIGGIPKLIEPNKCQEWKWFDLDALPKNLTHGTKMVLHNYFKRHGAR